MGVQARAHASPASSFAMGEVDRGVAQATEQPGMGHASIQGWVQVQHHHVGKGRGGLVRCLRRAALRSCVGEDERLFWGIRRRIANAL